ncbi:uncharacterized protein NPIL_388562 [Nephila pilipes]|uniref:EF-hand domain-containing protein n=1 Tax=Nephila pilipes TaxID=299642 RepID=A0A8X6UJD4_NEPPI|nr:uncharacterized protein NPIL_388562 [Nephila pilipes]
MKVSNTLVFMCVCVCGIGAQFFTKTTNSIPRLGKKSETHLYPNLVRRVAKQLHFIINMVNDYDRDSNGQLDAEEIMDIPFIQNAVKSEIEAKELRELPLEKQRANQNQMGSKD